MLYHNPTMRALCLLCLCVGCALGFGAAEAQYYSFGRNKVRYERFRWQLLRTEHFDVYYYPEMRDVAERGAYFAEEQYRELQARLGMGLARRVPLIFYSSQAHFQQTHVVPGFIPEGVGGFFEFLKGRVVVPFTGSLYRFRRVIRHELVHVFTHHKLYRVRRAHRVSQDQAAPPLWFTEGLAEYWSGPPDPQAEMVLRDAVLHNYLVPISDLFKIEGSYLMYKEGEALCRFIAEHWTEEHLRLLLEQAWKHTDFLRVLEDVLGVSAEELDERWLRWLRARYYARLPIETLPSLQGRTLTEPGFALKPAFYRDRAGRRWLFYLARGPDYAGVYRLELGADCRPVGRPERLITGEQTAALEVLRELDGGKLSLSSSGVLAFVAQSGPTDVLYGYDVESRRWLFRVRFPDLVALYGPSWSPDGQRLAFAGAGRSGYVDLYLYEPISGRRWRLTEDIYDDRDPTWSPDGRYVIFASDRTSWGKEGFYNLFSYELESGRIRYLVYGPFHCMSPAFDPSGRRVVFSATLSGTPDLWAVPWGEAGQMAASGALPEPPSDSLPLRRLARTATGALDPAFDEEGRLLYSAFEGYRFTIRVLDHPWEALRRDPDRWVILEPTRDEPWDTGRIKSDAAPYSRRYTLDLAQGQLSQSPLWGTTGGALAVFSDLMGDEQLYALLYHNAQGGGDLLRGLNVAFGRIHLGRRAPIAYGIYRLGGLQYDLTEPEASPSLPIYWETLYGAYVSLWYPFSFFRRLELGASLNWSDKTTLSRARRAFLLSNSLTWVHDNALWGPTGPAVGFRALLSLAYTTDLRYSHVSYYTVLADVRRYVRLWRDVTYAVWAQLRYNEGREARRFFMGGSWDVRGYPLFGIRGRHTWLLSQELRFPLVERIGARLPLLAPLGPTVLRGAVFADLAHAWEDRYRERIPELYAGETLASLGFGLRLNLWGALVLRYDWGWRLREGARGLERRPFGQFFFGWDF
ncbi:MAG: BamA/TamA family outer membrane protein [Bacteroidetes bacterium]|nr:BamA/TamA family outer membrane protein [Rhodothermia bacterium]MCX7906002.1 BamA/TamA family outer membrane protein [Bacteroidota bacterium]MDW8285814.1 BamA/TamA family outer membrane protein [Bacteroidota bacterium]